MNTLYLNQLFAAFTFDSIGPTAVSYLVWLGGTVLGGRVAYLAATGQISSAAALGGGAIAAVALGGETSVENLRVLCRAHNQFEAERVLGATHAESLEAPGAPQAAP